MITQAQGRKSDGSLGAWSLGVILLTGILLSACSRLDPVDPDPAPPVDAPAPTLGVITPGLNSFMTGAVTFVIEASNAETFELIVDDSTAFTGPAPVSWDSRLVDNGAHTFEVLAINAKGSASRTFVATTDNVGKGVIVVVSAPASSVMAGGFLTFQARVLGVMDQSVRWTVPDGPKAGSITAEGVYTAPNTIPYSHQATVVATSVECVV